MSEVLNNKSDSRAKNFRLMVYVAMFAFIVLAAYGYFLIYSLTRDVHSLALNVSRMTVSVEQNMQLMSSGMQSIDQSTGVIAVATQNMQRDMWSMNRNISTPLSMMNSFLPWGSNTGSAYPVAPASTQYYPPMAPTAAGRLPVESPMPPSSE